MQAEGIGMGAACGAEIVPLLLVVALFFWGRSVADKHRTRGWRVLSWMPVIGLVIQHVGVFITVLWLIRAFDEVAMVDASSRATTLARGISEAMNATAIGLGISGLLYLICAVAFTVGTLRPAPPPS